MFEDGIFLKGTYLHHRFKILFEGKAKYRIIEWEDLLSKIVKEDLVLTKSVEFSYPEEKNIYDDSTDCIYRYLDVLSALSAQCISQLINAELRNNTAETLEKPIIIWEYSTQLVENKHGMSFNRVDFKISSI